MTQNIADNVKRLRDVGSVTGLEGQTKYYRDSLQTINALVALVGEMSKTLESVQLYTVPEPNTPIAPRIANDLMVIERISSEALTKAAPIAELARE